MNVQGGRQTDGSWDGGGGAEMETLSHEEGKCRGWHGGAAGESYGTGSETRAVKVPVGHPGGEEQQSVGPVRMLMGEK